MYIDWDLLKKYSSDLQKQIDNLEKEVLDYFGLKKGELSLTSGNELGALLEVKDWKDHGRSKNKPTKNIVSFLKKKFGVNLTRKNGVYLTGDDQLEKWKKDGYKDIVNKILKHRELCTLMKTFIGGKVDNKNIDRGNLVSTFDWGLFQENDNEDIEKGFFQYKKSDGKIHSTFGPMMTKSQRNWSKAPNGQNIPKHGDLAKWYRKIFIPPSEDYYIVEQDAAGFQLRIGAIYSGDKEMKKVFTELGGDMHSMTAQAVLKRDISLNEFFKLKAEGNEEIKEIRFKAKAVNFGFLFGTVAYSFALGLEKEWPYKDIVEYVRRYNLQERVKFFLRILKGDRIGEDKDKAFDGDKGEFFANIDDKRKFANVWAVAADIRKKFFERYPGLEEWIKRQSSEAEEKGYVVSPFGAVRRLPQLTYQGKHDLKGKVKNWKNIALNSPVQNFESVYMNILMGEQNKYIKKNNLETHLCGNVHDANISYVHKDELKEFLEISKEIFERDRPENKGIPQELESNVADYYGKGEVWGFGTEI
jgi:DNA polymerase I-like protein with 3'-5' exonuclease and polymerase domains